MTAMSDYYNAAANRLQERGWCQFTYHDSKTGAYCLIGALIYLPHQTPELISQAVTDISARLGTLPQAWNDVKGRTADEVIGLLRQLAQESA